MWANYIKTLLAHAGINQGSIIDLSCGTGSLLSFFKQRKTPRFGSDLSFAMLNRARTKRSLKSVSFCNADFRHIPFKPASFDVALVLYDSINYLTDDEMVINFFREADSILKADGVLIFDVVTPYLCQTVFRNYSESHMESATNGYKRHSWFEAREQVQYNEFTIQYNGKMYHELHRQKIRPIENWIDIIEKSPLRSVGVYANFSMHRYHLRSERAHFVCCKKNSAHTRNN